MAELTESPAPGFSVYLRRRVLIVFAMGFASGLPLLLTLSTLSLWLAEAGIDKTTIGLFALVGVPYSVKFLWSPVIDRMPLPPLTTVLGRRRGWCIADPGAADCGNPVHGHDRSAG